MGRGRAGTDQFWRDMKQSGRATGGQSNQQRSLNPCSLCAISEKRAQIVSSVNTHWKLRCVGAGRFSETITGLAGSLAPTGSESNSRHGSWEAWACFLWGSWGKVLPFGLLPSSLALGSGGSFGAGAVPSDGCGHSGSRIWFGYLHLHTGKVQIILVRSSLA